MPAPFNRRWTDDMDELLIRHWHNGETATTIYLSGLFPGFTRNAIIGRLWRLRKKRGEQQVSHRDNDPVPRPAKKRVRRKPSNFNVKGEPVFMRDPTPVKTPPAPPTARRLPLLQLGPKDCRFIVTERAEPVHLYCAADASELVDTFGNNCYCRFHFRLMRAGVPLRRL